MSMYTAADWFGLHFWMKSSQPRMRVSASLRETYAILTRLFAALRITPEPP